MINQLEGAIVMFIPIVSVVALCALLSVAIWSSQRRREREIHYRHELLKRLVDEGADRLLLYAVVLAPRAPSA